MRRLLRRRPIIGIAGLCIGIFLGLAGGRRGVAEPSDSPTAVAPAPAPLQESSATPPSVVTPIPGSASVVSDASSPGPGDEGLDSTASGAQAGAPPVFENRLYVPPSSYDFAANPKLLQRIRASPHGYFRFINVAFSSEVCRRVVAEQPHMIRVNLHGDAHVEQYAVTELGRGLTDFDDSSSGPIALDLMRFAVSLRLVCRSHGWTTPPDDIIREFLRGYQAALENPELMAPEPSLVTAIRSGFKKLSPAYFSWVASLMDPLPEAELLTLTAATAPYVEAMKKQDPSLDQDYFRIVKMGGLRMGIGSALDKKYLIQIRGATDAPLDDVVLELKHVRDLAGIPCIHTEPFDPFRVLLGQARISYTPFRHLGYVRMNGENFWVHAWVYNYQELELDLFQNPQQLIEVAYDVGVQLGRGHPKQVADPFGVQFRAELRQLLTENEPRILQVAQKVELEVVEAWERFCVETSGN